jgi:ribose transport system substrate-binding protein
MDNGFAKKNKPSPMKPIGVIPKNTTHVYWKAVEAGAREGAQEAGVEMTWKGSPKEDDPAQQIQIVEQLVADGVGGLVLAPMHDMALKEPVASAMRKGIPVVIMDSALKGEPPKDFVSIVSTNNHRGGAMAGEQLGKLLDGKGKVVLFRFTQDSPSASEREEGFLEAIKAFPDIELILENRYFGTTVKEAQSTALGMLDRLKQADGIFCSTEQSTLGMLSALRGSKMARTKKLVGFDASQALMEGLRTGEIQALVAQNPKKMAHQAVKTLVAKMRGETVRPFVDTGAAVVTKDNLETPEIQALLACFFPVFA